MRTHQAPRTHARARTHTTHHTHTHTGAPARCTASVSQLKVDICVDNSVALSKTKLLAEYVRRDERARALCMCVKYWARLYRLNYPFEHTLSSYMWTLLAIHYLQTCEPAMLGCVDPQTLSVEGNRYQSVSQSVILDSIPRIMRHQRFDIVQSHSLLSKLALSVFTVLGNCYRDRSEVRNRKNTFAQGFPNHRSCCRPLVGCASPFCPIRIT